MNFSLARDAFESVKLTPMSALHWQQLCEYAQILELGQKSILVDEITSLALDDGLACWLRLSALTYLTQVTDWQIQQSALAGADTPTDAIMSVLGHVWFQALFRMPEKTAFVNQLRANDVTRLQRLVAQRLPTLDSAQRIERVPLRVAIYTSQLQNHLHGATAITLNMMTLLSLQGVDVCSFTAQEATISFANSQTGGLGFLQKVSVNKASMVLNAPGSAQMVLPDVEFSLRFRLERMQEAIHAYKPDMVVFVGFISPLIHSLYAHYPVLGLSLHALPPIAPVDVWLSADAQGDAALWPDLPVPQIAHYPFRFWPKGDVIPINRAKLQIPESAVVLITTGYRLDTQMPLHWCERMQAFIEVHSDVHWLLIGMPEGQSVVGWPAHSRIHGLVPQLGLEAGLAACDIYVNPPRMGGGGTVAMAMEQNLPVLTLRGADGGDKVGAWALESFNAYFTQLSQWVSDPTERRRVGAELKSVFHSRLDISSAQAQQGLLQACHSAIASFNKRTENRRG